MQLKLASKERQLTATRRISMLHGHKLMRWPRILQWPVTRVYDMFRASSTWGVCCPMESTSKTALRMHSCGRKGRIVKLVRVGQSFSLQQALTNKFNQMPCLHMEDSFSLICQWHSPMSMTKWLLCSKGSASTRQPKRLAIESLQSQE